MNTTRFAIVGGVAGIVLSTTTGWFVTGYLCHPFQKLTPSTWRPESWRQHALAVLWSGIGGCSLGSLDARLDWTHASAGAALAFASLAWAALSAPVIATLASYVNFNRVVVAGLLLEWWLFATGVSLACFLLAVQ